jgi:hypothetical protein
MNKYTKLGAAVAPVSVAPPLPICASCNRNPYGCVCNAPDPEPEYFKPGLNRDPDLHIQAMQSREAY